MGGSGGALLCGVVEKILSYKVIFEQRSEGSEGASQMNFWGKSVPGTRKTSAKALRQECTLAHSRSSREASCLGIVDRGRAEEDKVKT